MSAPTKQPDTPTRVWSHLLKPLHAVPISLTILRLVLGPFFVYERLHGAALSILFVIVIVAVLTDWLDGFSARKLGVVSAVGKLMDPVADVVFCMFVFSDFAWRNLMPWWILIAMACREGIINFLVRPMALYYRMVMAARYLGKTKTAFQFMAILSVLVQLSEFGARIEALPKVTYGIFLIALGFSLASGGQYLYMLFTAHRDGGADASRPA